MKLSRFTSSLRYAGIHVDAVTTGVMLIGDAKQDPGFSETQAQPMFRDAARIPGNDGCAGKVGVDIGFTIAARDAEGRSGRASTETGG